MIGDIKSCTGCSACYSICPERCISMKPDQEGFLVPEIDAKKCTGCDLCKRVCPEMYPLEYPQSASYPICYASINKDEEVRKDSSSGGLFSLIAEEIIKKKGVVFGARYADDFSIVHDWTETLSGLLDFRKSKYVQSSIGDAFRKCKSFLDSGRSVLFSGCPCQIEGLVAFLGAPPRHLFLVDFICTAIASPKVWRKYIEYREGISGSKTKCISFRRKIPSWYTWSIEFKFEDGTEYRQTAGNDAYCLSIGRSINNRISCFTCKQRKIKRVSDFTLADFWHVDSVCPEMFDNKGTSIVLVNSEKGEILFSEIRGKAKNLAIDIDTVKKTNAGWQQQNCFPHKSRSNFFTDIDQMPFNMLADKYLFNANLYIDKCIEYMTSHWNKNAQYFYSIWALTNYADMLVDYIKANYPQAKLTHVYDKFRTGFYNNIEINSPAMMAENLDELVFFMHGDTHEAKKHFSAIGKSPECLVSLIPEAASLL